MIDIPTRRSVDGSAVKNVKITTLLALVIDTTSSARLIGLEFILETGTLVPQ